MAKVTINDETLTGIATAIREKNQTETTYKPSEMAGAIQEIKGGLPENGFVVDEWDSNGRAISVTLYNLPSIPNWYFANNSDYQHCLALALTHVTFSNNTIKVGEHAFRYCKKLALTELPDTITTIGASAFYYCENLALTRLPNSLTTIDANAFYYCKKLALTELPNSLTTIGANAFSSCSELALMQLPSGVKSLGNSCFYYCKKLALTELPSGLTSIGRQCFSNCEQLKITEIPSGVTWLNSTAFEKCISLTKLRVNASNISGIEAYTFDSCENLTEISFPNVTSVPNLSNVSAFDDTPIANGTGYIYVPDTLVDSFKAATNWSTYADQIKPISEMPTE